MVEVMLESPLGLAFGSLFQEDGRKWSSGKFCFSRYEPLSSNMFSKPFPTVLEGMKDDWELML